MSENFDALETRDSAAREAALLAALPLQVAHAKKSSVALARILNDVSPAQVTSRKALAELPVIRKHELLERQQASRWRRLRRFQRGRLRQAHAANFRKPRTYL